MIVQKSLSVRGEVLLEQAPMGEPMEEVTAPLKRVHGSFKLCEPAAPVLSSFIIHVTIEQVLVELACTPSCIYQIMMGLTKSGPRPHHMR